MSVVLEIQLLQVGSKDVTVVCDRVCNPVDNVFDGIILGTPGSLPSDDLVKDDGKGVDIAFLGTLRWGRFHAQQLR